MKTLKDVGFYKLPLAGAVPTTGVPNSWYLKKTSTGFSIYLSDDSGNLIPADAGSGSGSDTYTGIAGEVLGGGKLVYLSVGKFYLFDANNVALADLAFGITKTSAVLNASVDIQITGIYTEVGLGLVADTEYYAGVTGLLTSIPNNIVITSIGIAVNADSIKLEIQPSIITI